MSGYIPTHRPRRNVAPRKTGISRTLMMTQTLGLRAFRSTLADDDDTDAVRSCPMAEKSSHLRAPDNCIMSHLTALLASLLSVSLVNHLHPCNQAPRREFHRVYHLENIISHWNVSAKRTSCAIWHEPRP